MDLETEISTPTQEAQHASNILMDERLIGAVRECGYLQFYQYILSDHRGAYVDVDIL
jgi:hypothetical protein